MTMLSNELYWLVLTVSLTGLMWVPYIINRIVEQGMLFAIWDPQGETATKTAWADRMARAHNNAVENLAIFAPLVLAIQFAQMNNDLTTMACMTYFYARLLHFIGFSLGVPVIRVVTFMVSVVAQFALAFTLLGIV